MHEFYKFLLHQGLAKFSSAKINNLILQKKVSGIDKVLNFKDFLRPNKQIKYISIEDLNWIQGLFMMT